MSQDKFVVPHHDLLVMASAAYAHGYAVGAKLPCATKKKLEKMQAELKCQAVRHVTGFCDNCHWLTLQKQDLELKIQDLQAVVDAADDLTNILDKEGHGFRVSQLVEDYRKKS